jgi:N-dimethylarginine dimethylaminohydrolase
MDSMYVRDASILTDDGIVLCNMGKRARRAEPRAQEKAFLRKGIPILGRIEGDGRLEGGDLIWLDQDTVVVGRGYRTNDEGIRQLKGFLGHRADQVVVTPLPHWKGPSDVFHLMSVISPIDEDLALVYSPLLPVPFREFLLSRGISLVEVPEEEFATMGCNVLTVAPRVCVMLEGNPETQARLQDSGVEVHTYRGEEISAPGEGGPTCLTRPILREV